MTRSESYKLSSGISEFISYLARYAQLTIFIFKEPHQEVISFSTPIDW